MERENRNPMNFLRNTYANAILMIDKIRNQSDKAAWHEFTDSTRRGYQTFSETSCQTDRIM